MILALFFNHGWTRMNTDAEAVAMRGRGFIEEKMRRRYALLHRFQ